MERRFARVPRGTVDSHKAALIADGIGEIEEIDVPLDTPPEIVVEEVLPPAYPVQEQWDEAKTVEEKLSIIARLLLLESPL